MTGEWLGYKNGIKIKNVPLTQVAWDGDRGYQTQQLGSGQRQSVKLGGKDTPISLA